MLVVDTELSTMTKNSLLRSGYLSMDDVCAAPVPELLRADGLGRKSINEIQEWARANGRVACDDRARLKRAINEMESRIDIMQRDLADARRKLEA